MFFLSWDLWQQMTFVLAMGIVAVFLAGLVKLWWNSRLMKKQLIVDEEKRARVEEMRRAGLPLKRTNDIPFGVRALQRGVEVDGIWISRPVSPNGTATTKVAPSVTVINLDGDKVVEDSSSDSKPVPISTTATESSPKNSPRLGHVYSTADDSRPAQARSEPESRIPRADGGLNEDTLRKLEGSPFHRPAYDTYAPTAAPHPRHQSSLSSSGESSPPQSVRSASGRSHASSRSSRLYMGKNMHEARIGYSTVYRQSDDYRDVVNGVVPARTQGINTFPNGPTADPNGNTNMLAPEPSFGPGDLHYNRKARRVNGGFEVLPAGTFGVLYEHPGPTGGSDADIDDNLDHSVRPMRPSNKLRKKSNGQLQEESLAYDDTIIYGKAM